MSTATNYACPTCAAKPGEPCRTQKGRLARSMHVARPFDVDLPVDGNASDAQPDNASKLASVLTALKQARDVLDTVELSEDEDPDNFVSDAGVFLDDAIGSLIAIVEGEEDNGEES